MHLIWSNGTSFRSSLPPETKYVTALRQRQEPDCVNCPFQNHLATSTNIAIEQVVDASNKNIDAFKFDKDGVDAQLDTHHAKKCHQDNVIRVLETRLDWLQAKHIGVHAFEAVLVLVVEMQDIGSC